MPRPKGVAETAPRKPGGGGKRDGAGRPPGTVEHKSRERTIPPDLYANRYASDRDGSGVIRLPNAVLAHFERLAMPHGLSVPQYLHKLEIDSRIL